MRILNKHKIVFLNIILINDIHILWIYLYILQGGINITVLDGYDLLGMYSNE